MTRLASEPRHPPILLEDDEHLFLDGVSWGFYEHLLRETRHRRLRITFDSGMLEITSRIFGHEAAKSFIGQMISTLSFLTNCPMASGGSPTFRRRDKQKGLEPDECYFFNAHTKVRRIKRWNPKFHPPPDLAVEIDIFSRSIDREPIYAALAVPELWHYDGARIRCLHLIGDRYSVRKRSKFFPFLEVSHLSQFMDRVEDADHTTVIREFISWVKRNGWAAE